MASPIPTPPKNLLLTPMTPSEVPLYQSIRHTAFQDTVNRILYSRDPSPETIASVHEGQRKDLEKPNVHYMLAKDAETGEVWAGSKWEVFLAKERGGDGLRTREEVEKGLEVPEPYGESDERLWRAFFKVLYEGRREIMGRREYMILYTLVTHPSHQRKGAGSQLLKWGCAKADELGLECYLEASPMGVSLYEKFGFKRIRDLVFDMRDYWGPDGGDFVLTLMLRVPNAGGQ